MQVKDFVNPKSVLKHLDIKPGDRVADLGAGSGVYTLGAAEYVGESGRVYAFDVQKDLLTRISNQAKKLRLENVDIIWTDIETPGSTRFSDGVVDLVILSNVLFQVPDKNIPLREAARIVRPEGRVVIIDWTESFGGMGPHPDDVITEAEAIELAESNGLSCAQQFTPGAHHWGLVCHRGQL